MATKVGTSEETCKHHWVIETANGPYSKGKCKLCEEVKYFENSPEERKLSSEQNLANNRKAAQKRRKQKITEEVEDIYDISIDDF